MSVDKFFILLAADLHLPLAAAVVLSTSASINNTYSLINCTNSFVFSIFYFLNITSFIIIFYEM